MPEGTNDRPSHSTKPANGHERHQPPLLTFPLIGVEGMELSEVAMREWQDVAEEDAACDGMRFLSRLIVARG